MQRTPLYQFHLDRGARMVDFAGWEMPIAYKNGVLAEHHQVRRSGGVFDVSHMGRVEVKGRHARRFLEKLCTRRISDMEKGQCRYSLVCNERGGVRDDIIVSRFDEDEFLLVVNASNREKLLGHFQQVKGDMAVAIDDKTMNTAMVALQGPKVMDLISGVSREIPTLKKYRFTVKNLMVMKLIVSRTGYTGEDGVEVILPAKAIGMAMKLLLKDVDLDDPNAVLTPAGLAARDTLRLEAGMPLYGHELSEDWDALSSRLTFAIALDKGQNDGEEKFIGQDALLKIQNEGGPKRLLVGLELEGRRSARQGMKVRAGGAEVGEVTSACLSPTLEKPIALAYVDAAQSEVGAALEIDTGKGSAFAAKVVPTPFYKAPKKEPAKA
ncbi:MAG: glycine cleavage system aminomethyltransferase GcvT [Phycisphaerales bacterium]